MTLKKVRARLEPSDRSEREQRAQTRISALIQDARVDVRKDLVAVISGDPGIIQKRLDYSIAQENLRVAALRICFEEGLGDEIVFDLYSERKTLQRRLARIRSDVAILRELRLAAQKRDIQKI